MRYLFSVIANKNFPVAASSHESQDIDLFNEKIEKAGQRIVAVGISSPSSAVVFDNRENAQLMTTGPVNDSDDFVAGFWIIEAENNDVAYELAAEASRACNRRIEVRAILG